ncbi:MAG: OmpA family protein [Alphaproteobacteria bacterium]|nr:OmpA family protein [Alphaproteobacteria bacterium]
MKKVIMLSLSLAIAACAHAPKELEGQQAFFAFDSAEISSDARKELAGQALYMKKHPDINVTLQGRCDERGSTEYNLALGALRAGNAAHVMIYEGIEPERIKTISYGKENPIYPGTGEEVWAKNRNTTTVVQKPVTE